jgi:hypothetical protein
VTKVSSSKAVKRKFHDVWKLEFLWLTYDSSNNVTDCDICRKAGSDIAGKTKFATGNKKFKLESLPYHNKSLKQTNV